MRLGVLAYDTPTGLGYQTKAYVKHLNPTKVMVVDLTGFNGMPTMGWYPEQTPVIGYPKEADMVDFLRDLDVVLFAETPLNYDFYKLARNMGVKTANVINWEFFDHIQRPDLPLPDLFIMPSTWHLADMEAFGAAHNVPVVQLHHPVDTEAIQFRERSNPHFMHIAGNPAVNDRNGTHDYFAANPSGLVTTQNGDLATTLRRRYPQSRIHTNILDQNHLYSFGDILVLPRKYGGNCLPLNEALAAGLPVIMPDISPNNSLLPPEWLVPAVVTDRFTPRTTIDIYQTDIEALRQKMNWFRTIDIRKESLKARAIADTISWNTLKPEYERVLNTI